MSDNNVLDLLLTTDVSKIVRPKKEVEIKRLSDIAGNKVIFTCQGLTSEEVDYVAEASRNGGNNLAFYILEGVKNPDFKNQALLKKYGAITPKELVDKLLLPGEISKLYDIISELSGFGNDAVEDVKNE